ncbi:Lsr2 family protein [Pseudonocardia sp. C8]|uniref:Lsr2 dimerization domain-containing protein n=1 Tax=Pseudonocardia sp. C8 TaxID=2762759 RepID=UPI0016431E91|nr:histone-like nucleoid-structuring protein Lsr2 [Pseudonocardia sp. C8]MBC3192290.1 Lsr2 family protein [Pseudonocardia sp. C8]
MGIRQIRFCDLTGTENDVESHEIHIDQMRIQIDLAGSEYRRLLETLKPFIDAGRVDASVPDEATLPGRGGRRGRAPTRSGLSAAERDQLRQWAEAKGIPVPSNNRFKRSLIAQWREETAPGTSEGDAQE